MACSNLHIKKQIHIDAHSTLQQNDSLIVLTGGQQLLTKEYIFALIPCFLQEVHSNSGGYSNGMIVQRDLLENLSDSLENWLDILSFHFLFLICNHNTLYVTLTLIFLK